MASVQDTPRKRSAPTAGAATPQTTRKRKADGSIPTPNPPLAPFPTPPRSRRRRTDHGADEVDLASDSEPAFLTSSPFKPAAPLRSLPHHLQTILTLHHAFNAVLSLHMATHPPVLPPHPASTTLLQVPNLTNILAIRDAVERTSGRRFGQQELARLAWVWAWDGKSLSAESSTKKEDDDNPFLVKPKSPSTTEDHVSGLSYLITTTRTLCPKTGRRVHTHGIGIELEIEPGETRQTLAGGVMGGLGNSGQGGGVRVIGRWSAGAEVREAAVREKLERWMDLHGGDVKPPIDEPQQLPTPSTHDSGRSTIPPVPLLPLPKLPSAAAPGARLFSSGSDLLPAFGTPRKQQGLDLPPAFATPKQTTIPGLSDPFEITETPKAKTPAKGSIEERRQAMAERIKARSQSAKAARSTLAGDIEKGSVILKGSAAEQLEELRRRSTLSRLESIAEGVWMLFSAPSPGPSSLPTAPRGRRKAIPMREVSEMIVKSSKTPISEAEAQTSLKMLTELCPFFLQCKVVGRQEWLEMPPAVVAPPSPSEAALASPQSSPRAGRVSGLSSPSLAGPASPGRVRRAGGLREVRERIRRELGE